MDLIKIYYSALDVQPERLLRHFFRSIGFYVDEIPDDIRIRENHSLADIYIIGNEYAAEFQSRAENLNERKSILVFKDGWSIQELPGMVRAVFYNVHREDDFLRQMIGALDSIIFRNGIHGRRLFETMEDWKTEISAVADSYWNCDIPKIVQYSRYFYRQQELFQIAYEKYTTHIMQLEKLMAQSGNSPLLQYIMAYAKYEFNYICRQNLFECLYDPDELAGICDLLLELYEPNEEVCFLLADIHFHLQDKWQQACGEYEDERVSHCAYGDYKCGRIVRMYLKDYDMAITVLKRAIGMKPDYFAAYYQLAASYEGQEAYSTAMEYYSRLIEILKEKFQRQLLSALELEYLYKTIMKIAMIYEHYLGSYSMAEIYYEMADDIKAEIDDDTYLRLTWPEVLGNQRLVQTIRDEMYAHVREQIEKVYA